MSTVRMSMALQSHIVNEYKSAYKRTSPVLNNAGYNGPAYDATDGDKLYDQYMFPLLAHTETYISDPLYNNIKLENKINPEGGCVRSGQKYPKEYFSHTTKLWINLPLSECAWYAVDTGDHTQTVDMLRTRNAARADGPVAIAIKDTDYRKISIPLSKEVVVPCHYNSYDPSPLELYFTSSEVAASTTLSNITALDLEYKKAKLQREYEICKLEDLLTQFTTLNQALKAWPGISKLVTSNHMAKVNEKQQRKRKQQKLKLAADEAVSAANLNNTILTSSLLGDN